MIRVAVILAAGMGTRMRSRLPKVLHPVAGRPMLSWVLEAARAADCDRVMVVVGHGSERVREELDAPDVTWVEQAEQLGTGHALAQAAGSLEGEGVLLVLSGDVPMVRAATLATLADAAAAGWGSMAVAELDEPGSLGRVLCREDGSLERIVEAADAGPGELAVRLVNAGLYCLPFPQIFDFIAGVRPDNAKGEIYLTDAVVAAAAAGRAVAPIALDDPGEALGVNTRGDLAHVHRRMLGRKIGELQEGGVTLLDPERTEVEPSVEVGGDTTLHSSVALYGDTRVGRGCTLHQGVWIRNSVLADGVTVHPYSVLDGADVGPGCSVGPFARLRPGAELGEGSKIGNFVEVKNSQLAPGVKAGHLTYLGDATIGEGANIGAGTVTCNYDGVKKSRTEIGARAFIGSDTMLVAPLSVGDDAVTGAGSTIAKDVPSGALAVERSQQRHVEGWAQRKRKKRKPEGG
jgi:bifunctional UDP-N-acetylglucosamine pyrophosphorylase/glucosamine-1-phosphate N-acetyltransferase